GAWLPAFVVILAIAAVGWPALRRRVGSGAFVGLATAAGLGLVVAMGVAFPGAGGVVRWAGVHVPGGGVLRDGQKFVAPWAILLAAGFGAGVERIIAGGAGSRVSRTAATGVAVALPIALAPTLALAATGRLRTSNYPPDWGTARGVMAADPHEGAVLVLPWHLYMPFGWNHDQPVIDPASAFFTRRAVESDSLEVGRVRLPPEDPWSRLADPLARGRGPIRTGLSSLGVRYVLLLHAADWRPQASRTAGLTLVLRGPD